MRAVLLRYAAVVAIGLALLVGILYYATTVDGRAPLVERIGLTLHASEDEQLALTTSGVEVEFSEEVVTVSAERAFRIEPAVDGQFNWSGRTLLFTPQDRLPLETEFSVWVEAGVVDPAGNRMPDATAPFEFRTVGPPGVASTEPADGAEDVPLDAAIVIEFNSLMDTASVEDALRIAPSLPYEVSWSAERLTLLPSRQLQVGTRYVVTIGTDARDSEGIPVAGEFQFSFESAAAPISATQLVPADGTEGVALISPVAVFFDRELDEGADPDDLFSIEPEVAGTLEVVQPPGAAGLDDPVPRVLRFEPSGPLAPNTTYRVTLEPGIAAEDGSQLAEGLEWSFTTGAPLVTLGNQIVFLSDRSGVPNLWATNPDGSGQRQVTAELSPVIDYAVAPDGRSVVVGDGAVLALQTADGSDRRLLTAAGLLEFDPAWSPDGTRFAFGRAELESGAGLGIWTRAPDGGDEQPLDLPPQPTPGANSASPSEGPDALPPSILRSPRYSPDGSALAFVDLAGQVGVLGLSEAELRRVRVVAVGPPVWLSDSRRLVVSSINGDPLERPEPGGPLPAMDPATLPLSAADVASLELRLLDRGAATSRLLDVPAGAARPAVSGGQLLFVVAGELRLAADLDAPGTSTQLLDDGGAPVAWATFGVEQRTVVVARVAEGGPAEQLGIWLVDTVTGQSEQLTEDGLQPRWLP